MSNQQNIFQIIIENTLAVMTDMPEKIDEWRSELIEIEKQAKSMQDEEMEKLLQALLELLNGVELENINPVLTDIYKHCWEIIVENLSKRSNPVVIVVERYVNSKTWQRCKEIVEQNSKLLLTDEAERVIDDLIEKYKDNPNVARLEKLKNVLIKCRSLGIDVAFHDVLSPTAMPYIPPELLNQLMAAKSDHEIQELVKKHPSLIEVLNWMQEQSENNPAEAQKSLEDRLSEPALQNPEEGVKRFVTYLNTRDLLRLQKYCLSILSEISCSPWKFDVLWDLWDELQFKISQSASLANELLFTNDPELRLFAFAAFDDLTVFADIVGESGENRIFSRESYRAAYLLIRPMVFRHQYGAPPLPPHAMTSDAYTKRIAMVGSMLSDETRKDTYDVLSAAEKRYSDRGKNDGAIFCKQTADIMRTIESGGLFNKGTLPFVEEMFKLMMSADKQVLSYEIALNWWPIIKHIRDGILRGEDKEATDALNVFVQDIQRLSPFAWLTELRPGIASTMVILVALRLNVELEHPYSMLFFPTYWLGNCQENIIFLKEQWTEEPPIPKEYLHMLLDAFVFIGHSTRTDTNIKSSELFFEDAVIFADVMSIAKRRAREELSIAEFAKALEHLHEKVKKVPFAVEGLITMASMPSQLGDEGSIRRSILEAAAILAPYTENQNLVEIISIAINQPNWTVDQKIQFAGLKEKEGRPDLAVDSLYNAGAQLFMEQKYERCIEVYSIAREMTIKILENSLYVPSTTVFDGISKLIMISQELGKSYFMLEKYQNVLEIIDETLSRFTTLTPSNEENRFDIGRKVVFMHVLAAECLERLEGYISAERRLESAYDAIPENDQDYLLSILKAKSAFYAKVNNKIDQAISLFTEALLHVSEHRRTLPYESDKVDFNSELAVQASSIYLAEININQNKYLDAIAAFEAGRSRALLDLIGISASVKLPPTAEDEMRNTSQKLLDRVRSIAYPGIGNDDFGMRAHWVSNLSDLDKWLSTIENVMPEYVRIVRGKSLSPNEIINWVNSVKTPTAVVYWLLGNEYSYCVVQRAFPGKEYQDPIVQKISVTIPWLQSQSKILQEAVKSRKNPPPGFFDSLSKELITPVKDFLQDVDAIYLCQSHNLYDLPLPALLLSDQPLNVIKQTSVIPSLSVLSVLQYMDRFQGCSNQSVVFGPEFPRQANWIGKLLGTEAVSVLPQAELLQNCQIMHLITHGYFDNKDIYASGFQYVDEGGNHNVLTGRQIMRQGLGARLVVLEACDTRRQLVTFSDDSFGLARFFQIAGSSSILLSDWEVRNDVTMRFMKSFYGNLDRHSNAGSGLANRGEAYRSAVKETRDWVGHENIFLWAPFTFVGLLD